MFPPEYKLLNKHFSPRCETIPFQAISHRRPRTFPPTALAAAIALDFPSELDEGTAFGFPIRVRWRHNILAVKHRKGKVTLSPSWIAFIVLKGAVLPAERERNIISWWTLTATVMTCRVGRAQKCHSGMKLMDATNSFLMWFKDFPKNCIHA